MYIGTEDKAKHCAHSRLRYVSGILLSLLLASCSTSLPPVTETSRHLEAGSQTGDSADIPDVVSNAPLVTEPQAQESPELFSVVAQDVSVRELLFAMGRDANINVDVHPAITGQVFLNVIDQSLPQILDRIARQVNMRWRFDNSNNLIIEPDSPYWKTYRVDYVNVERSANTSADISTSIGSVAGSQTTGSGNNNSSSALNQSSSNNFWATLRSNLAAIMGEDSNLAQGTVSSIVSNPESGVINVRATEKEHAEIRDFIDFVQARSLHQVLIEATVVEVNLSDRYQSGVDWSSIVRDGAGDISFVQEITDTALGAPPTSILTINRDNNNDADISATVSMLSRFGDLRVLSSPKLMALNNQAALLRVVDNKVYFTVEVQPPVLNPNGGVATPAIYSTEVHTVPVGFVMNVTPQVSEDDQITLNVRPTISRIVRYVQDPNPILRQEGASNEIPEIQIREIESILRLQSGEIAILGGLMQDSLEQNTSGLPGLSRIPGLRNLFSNRDDTAQKTELIVFIKPIVIRQPSLGSDLQSYEDYLPAANSGAGISPQ